MTESDADRIERIEHKLDTLIARLDQMMKPATYNATPEHVKTLMGENEPCAVFMPNDVELGDHEGRDRRTAEMKRKQRDAQYEHHKAYMADPEREQRLFAHHMKREAEIDAILNPPRGWLHRLLLG